MPVLNLLIAVVLLWALLYVIDVYADVNPRTTPLIRVAIIVGILLYLRRLFLNAGPAWELYW